MAYKLIYVWWDELDRHDMPTKCIVCAKKAKWVNVQFKTTRYEYMRNWDVTRKSEAPVCSDHGGGWLQYVHSRDFDKQGVWISNACDEFISALKKYRKEEVKKFKEEMADEDIDDFDDSNLPPGMREPPEEPRTSVMQWIGLAFAGVFFLVIISIFLVVFGVMCCGGGLAIFGVGGAAVQQQQQQNRR